MTDQQSLPDINYEELERLFDKTKSKVFMGKSAAFLGPLMCSMNFAWTTDIETACTNGISINWNPYFFLALPPEVRETILIHELKHPAHLDMLRRGTRDPLLWNWAADIRINNELIDEGYSFKGFKPWFNFDYRGWVTEDIYDDLAAKKAAIEAQMGPGSFQMPSAWLVNPVTGKHDGVGDLVEPEETDINAAIRNQVLQNVISAQHQTQLAGFDVDGEIKTALKRFLQPKLPWEQLLRKWFHELGGQDYSLRRPNRRYHDVYMASLLDEDNGLAHIMCFEDVSGSISDNDSIRFNSEFKHIKDYFQPEKITAVQFDDQIQKVDVFNKEDAFDEIIITGRGGTSLVPVRDYIIEHKPTAVIIFSDLQCDPMEKLPADVSVPVIWICLDNHSAQVNEGQLVHFRN